MAVLPPPEEVEVAALPPPEGPEAEVPFFLASMARPTSGSPDGRLGEARAVYGSCSLEAKKSPPCEALATKSRHPCGTTHKSQRTLRLGNLF